MQLRTKDNKKIDIPLFGSTFLAAAQKIVAEVPDRDDLPGSILVMTWVEEDCFDANLRGMFWPAMFGIIISEQYALKDGVSESFGGQIGGFECDIPNDSLAIRFTSGSIVR